MPRQLLHISLLLAFAASGCAQATYGVFATSTNIGIDADATAGKVVLGYDRTEGFVGPAYPEAGTAPPVFGFIDSNQNVFDPKVRQLYATGRAAELVTQQDTPAPPPPVDAVGKSPIMVFGTTTSIALRIGYGATAPLPDSISLGYKRREASVIPVERPTPGQPAKYASTLASVDMGTTTSKGPGAATLGVRQFFATGNAALNLAASDDIRQIYRGQAKNALSAGEIEGKAVVTGTTDLARCIQLAAGKLEPPATARWMKAVDAGIEAGVFPKGARDRDIAAATTDEVLNVLNRRIASASELSKVHAQWELSKIACDKKTV